MKMHHALNSKSVTTCGIEISSLNDESDATHFVKNVDCSACLQKLLHKKESSRIIYKTIEKDTPKTIEERAQEERNDYFNHLIAIKRKEIIRIHKEIDKLIIERDKPIADIFELTSYTKQESSR